MARLTARLPRASAAAVCRGSPPNSPTCPAATRLASDQPTPRPAAGDDEPLGREGGGRHRREGVLPDPSLPEPGDAEGAQQAGDDEEPVAADIARKRLEGRAGARQERAEDGLPAGLVVVDVAGNKQQVASDNDARERGRHDTERRVAGPKLLVLSVLRSSLGRPVVGIAPPRHARLLSIGRLMAPHSGKRGITSRDNEGTARGAIAQAGGTQLDRSADELGHAAAVNFADVRRLARDPQIRAVVFLDDVALLPSP